jgi:curved DNA-binding protein CbpA
VHSIPSVDLYRELEVDPAATAETIDAAWKSLLKRYHPDVASNPAATLERVKRLNLAHEWLSDAGLREMYDRTRRRPTVIAGPGSGRGRGPGARTRTPTPSPVSAAADAAKAAAAAQAAAKPAPNAAPSNPPSPEAAGVSSAGSPTPDAPPAPDPAPVPDPSDPAADPNPYREFNRPRPASAPTARRWQTMSPSRMPSYLLPVALVSILMIVALSSYLATQRVAPGPSDAAVQIATSAPSHRIESASSAVVASGAVDPRTLPSPDIRADLPAVCADSPSSSAFSFSDDVGRSVAQVVVVRCDEQRSFGPLVYLAGAGGWTLSAKGTFEDGYAYQAFTGRISGKAADEFGIAWTSGDGTKAHVVLYRVNRGLEVFWNSADASMAWDLASFDYQPFADPATGGYLVITSADLTTGTCVACHDHTLYREFYLWSTAGSGSAGLVRSSRQPYGIGP